MLCSDSRSRSLLLFVATRSGVVVPCGPGRAGPPGPGTAGTSPCPPPPPARRRSRGSRGRDRPATPAPPASPRAARPSPLPPAGDPPRPARCCSGLAVVAGRVQGAPLRGCSRRCPRRAFRQVRVATVRIQVDSRAGPPGSNRAMPRNTRMNASWATSSTAADDRLHISRPHRANTGRWYIFTSCESAVGSPRRARASVSSSSSSAIRDPLHPPGARNGSRKSFEPSYLAGGSVHTELLGRVVGRQRRLLAGAPGDEAIAAESGLVLGAVALVVALGWRALVHDDEIVVAGQALGLALGAVAAGLAAVLGLAEAASPRRSGRGAPTCRCRRRSPPWWWAARRVRPGLGRGGGRRQRRRRRLLAAGGKRQPGQDGKGGGQQR